MKDSTRGKVFDKGKPNSIILIWKCKKCKGQNIKQSRRSSIGKTVDSYCVHCKKSSKVEIPIMGYTKIRFCDMCGKRNDFLPYTLMIQKENRKTYSKKCTASLRICSSCGDKFSASIINHSSELREEIENKIDDIRVERLKKVEEVIRIESGDHKIQQGNNR